MTREPPTPTPYGSMNDVNNPRISSNLLFASLLLILTFLKKDYSDGTVTVSKRSDRNSVHLKKALFIFHEELTGLQRDAIFVLEGLTNQSVCINVICNAPIFSTISDRFSSLCARVSAAAILENEKTLDARLVNSNRPGHYTLGLHGAVIYENEYGC